MPALILNPRGSPRVPVGCTARIALRAGSFVATTIVDVGPGGFGVELPLRSEAGERVFVELRADRVPGTYLATGRIAWVSEATPWRCGIAFDEASTRTAARFFERLAGAYPDLVGERQLVESVPEDAVLAPTQPPAHDALAPAEAEILRQLGDGAEVRALRERLGPRWSANALFSLLGRRAVEIRRQ